LRGSAGVCRRAERRACALRHLSWPRYEEGGGWHSKFKLVRQHPSSCLLTSQCQSRLLCRRRRKCSFFSQLAAHTSQRFFQVHGVKLILRVHTHTHTHTLTLNAALLLRRINMRATLMLIFDAQQDAVLRKICALSLQGRSFGVAVCRLRGLCAPALHFQQKF
jgi:hypothetical protein